MIAIADKLKNLNSAFYKVVELNETQINGGYCFVWAWLAHEMIPNSILVSGDDHAAIKLNDRYYDSESIYGETSYFHLTCLRYEKRLEQFPLIIQTDQEFFDYWSDDGTVEFPNCTRLKNTRLLEELRRHAS